MNASKYFSNVKPRLFEIAAWARDGMSEKDMAKKCDVPYSSWKTYKKEHKELEKAIREHKEIFDIKLENAFFRRCLGYSYEEDTKELIKDNTTGELKLEVVKKVKKEIPPDVNALKFALSNRMKGKYADKQVLEHEGEPLKVIFNIPRPKDENDGGNSDTIQSE